MTARQQAKREAVRPQAAGLFAQGMRPPEVARRLRISRKSAYAWHERWRSGGREALASAGPGGAVCRLDAGQLAELAAVLQEGPAASGWVADQRWTLARMAEVIEERFGVSYTPRGVSYLLHRIGFSPQVPAHRAAERNEEAVERWRKERWSQIKGRPGSWARG